MGLDLYHLKAVLEPADPGDYLDLECFAGEPFEEYGLAQYVRDVPTIRVVHTARFFATTIGYEFARSRHSTSGYGDRATYFLGTPESFQRELRSLEERLSLSPGQASLDRRRWLQDGVEHEERFVCYSEPTTEKGIYFIEIGYQRKSMNYDFYDDYRSDHAYLEASRFTKLCGYLWDGASPEVAENLRTDFIENYEQGRSMLYFTA